MGRAFGFPNAVADEARLRQGGKCACCGEDLDDILEHAHHVVPNQSGRAGADQHAWLASVDNCVVLCETCHYRVHQDGRYRDGAVAPPEYYLHSHGDATRDHQQWTLALRRMSGSVWG